MIREVNFTRRPLSRHIFHPHSELSENINADSFSTEAPDMLRRVYSADESFDGRGVKIAVISALDNTALQENIEIFCEKFGFDAPEISVHYPFGRSENTSREWLTESSLDTQWIHVFAPGAQIDAVFAKDASVTSLLDAARYAQKTLLSDIVCMCFGTDESASDAELVRFMKDGKIFVSSSGDVGGRVSFPSTSPQCISVGGTNLSFSPSGKSYSETAWKNTGGGKSNVFAIPMYQEKFLLSSKMRGTPDVSMCANYNPGAPVYISQLGGWKTAGGTSLSAACFAGICACIKQKHPEIVTSLDMLSFLYSKAGGDGYEFPQYNFYDITIGKSGDNYAEKGWDFATGLGSPVINQILS